MTAVLLRKNLITVFKTGYYIKNFLVGVEKEAVKGTSTESKVNGPQTHLSEAVGDK
ncbi:hypothetical protein JK621_08030 [Serratia plymuthica]|uniref:hypothetical protein n=1 Tax=Serratia plymuthica TaxID=82996 RepID=UPI001BAF0C9D|nr:hypothetical protein [Serratia plymuthica]QUY50088.1 hypothetical protein JK621_08030 [Serratia plymuthica]